MIGAQNKRALAVQGFSLVGMTGFEADYLTTV
jgi:hypothetical protein